VDISYPSTYVSFDDEQAELPPTQRKYLNPNNGKWVAYGRAKQLGLIK